MSINQAPDEVAEPMQKSRGSTGVTRAKPKGRKDLFFYDEESVELLML